MLILKLGKLTIDNTKAWLTDQAYTSGHGEWRKGTGPHDNFNNCSEALGGNEWTCVHNRHPWAAPGRAPSLGGGCGYHGGNPGVCPYFHDDRPAGSQCLPDVDRGTWSFGSAAVDIDFPQARTTEWTRGSVVPVGFVSIPHWGGYNYRLCKMPSVGKAGLSEECFARNILKFAENKTYWRDAWWANRNQEWKTESKTDVP